MAKQSKSGTKKKREKKYRPLEEKKASAEASGEYDGGSGGGAMQSMVGGFRRAVGVEKDEKKGRSDVIWTILLVIAIAALLFWRFGNS